jgi:hypothetical protein
MLSLRLVERHLATFDRIATAPPFHRKEAFDTTNNHTPASRRRDDRVNDRVNDLVEKLPERLPGGSAVEPDRFSTDPNAPGPGRIMAENRSPSPYTRFFGLPAANRQHARHSAAC